MLIKSGKTDKKKNTFREVIVTVWTNCQMFVKCFNLYRDQIILVLNLGGKGRMWEGGGIFKFFCFRAVRWDENYEVLRYIYLQVSIHPWNFFWVNPLYNYDKKKELYIESDLDGNDLKLWLDLLESCGCQYCSLNEILCQYIDQLRYYFNLLL